MVIGLDNDAIFADCRTAARAVAVLDGEPALAAIGLRILRHADGGDDLSSWGYPRALLACAGEAMEAVTFVGAGHAIRRAAWAQVGGYDASLFFCWEEFDFCLRAIARGWRISYRGDIAVRHKVSAEARELWSDRRWFFFVRNRLYIARKHGASWGAMLPRVLGYGVRGLRNGLGWATWRAMIAAIRMQAGITRVALPAQARQHLRDYDRRHRGPWPRRLGQEVLAALPGQARAFPPQQPQHQRVIQQIAPP